MLEIVVSAKRYGVGLELLNLLAAVLVLHGIYESNLGLLGDLGDLVDFGATESASGAEALLALLCLRELPALSDLTVVIHILWFVSGEVSYLVGLALGGEGR